MDVPLGSPLPNFDGCQPPQPTVLRGLYTDLVPLDPAPHAEALFASSLGDSELWTYLPAGPFTDANGLREWLTKWRHTSWPDGDHLPFVIIDKADGLVYGHLALMRIRPSAGSAEVGMIWFGSQIQRTRVATEAIFLVGKYLFDDLNYRRWEWKCNSLNARSKRAAERFGFTYEGCFRNDLVVKGHSRDTDWYSIIDSEWPKIGQAFADWLEPSNFEQNGKQINRLDIATVLWPSV